MDKLPHPGRASWNPLVARDPILSSHGPRPGQRGARGKTACGSQGRLPCHAVALALALALAWATPLSNQACPELPWSWCLPRLRQWRELLLRLSFMLPRALEGFERFYGLQVE
jgi:hypothetical protein